jgi:hypothetical protein
MRITLVAGSSRCLPDAHAGPFMQGVHPMTYQGERARELATERGSTLAVSKVKLDDDGRITAVRWGKVNTQKNDWATPEVIAPVAQVVAAIDTGSAVFALFPSLHGHLPERRFMNVDYDDGRRTIVLEGPATHEREIHDMDRLV